MNHQAISQFKEVCNTSETRARKTLEAAGWDLEVAIGRFFTTETDPKLVKVFDSYKETEDSIGIDGTIQYLGDLGIEPEDIRSLILAYFLESPEMGQFSRGSFLKNWSQVKIVSLAGMKTHLDSLKRQMESDFDAFKRLYEFTFTYLVEKDNQKLLAYDLTIDYWRLLFSLRKFGPEVDARLEQWYTFIASAQKGVTHDTYSMFLHFVDEIIAKDPENMSDYSEMSSWPSTIDEYIEYLVDHELLAMELSY